MQITFNLEANSSLAENVNLTITNVVATTFPNSTGMDISDVWVGFQYAQPWSSFVSANTASGQIQNHFLTALDGDWLVLNTSATMQSIGSLSVLYQMAFHFPASGEYSPSIIIGLYNGTFLAQTYNQIQIQIPSSTELKTQALDQISGYVAIALVVFASIELFKLVHELTEKTSKLSTNQDPTIGDDA